MLREALLLAIPTAFDLAATVLMNVGLLSVTASVYQMVRTQSGRTAKILSLAILQQQLASKYALKEQISVH